MLVHESFISKQFVFQTPSIYQMKDEMLVL